VHQHPLPRVGLGQLHERHVGGGKNDRYRGGFGVGPARGLWHQQTHVSRNHGSAALGEESVHRVTDREFRDSRADFDHHAGALAAEQCVVGENAQRDHDVAEVRRDGAQCYPHRAWLQRRPRVGNRLQAQVLERARAAQPKPPRPIGRRRQQVVGGAAAAHPRGVHRFATHQCLRLTRRQHRGDCIVVEGHVGIDEDDPARMFGLRRPHQAPYRRTRQVRDILSRQTHRAPGGHHQHARVAVGQPRLHGAQHKARALITIRYRITDAHNGFKHFIRHFWGRPGIVGYP